MCLSICIGIINKEIIFIADLNYDLKNKIIIKLFIYFMKHGEKIFKI